MREMVRKWQLKPASENGQPVQIEALVTFTFQTKQVGSSSESKAADTSAPTPAGTSAQSQSQWQGPRIVPPRVEKMVTPDCNEGQTCHGIHGEVVVVLDVLADGTAGDISVRSGDPRLFDDAKKAAKQCTFAPGTFLGKPTSMNLNLKFEF